MRWVVVAVKHWAVNFNLISDDFSSFSLIWLVLFVMMKYKIVPPIIDLWKMHCKHEPIYIEGKFNLMLLLILLLISYNLYVT